MILYCPQISKQPLKQSSLIKIWKNEILDNLSKKSEYFKKFYGVKTMSAKKKHIAQVSKPK